MLSAGCCDDQIGLSRCRARENPIVGHIFEDSHCAQRTYNSRGATDVLQRRQDIPFGLVEFPSEDDCGFSQNRRWRGFEAKGWRQLPQTSEVLLLAAGHSRMDDAEAQSLLEWIVVPVIMQKMVTVKQAEAGNEAVNRLTNCNSLQSEGLVVLSGRDGKSYSSRRKDLESFQRRTSGLEFPGRSDPLEHFAENQICEPQTLPAHFPVEPFSLRRGAVPEIIDPYRRVDQCHDARGTRDFLDSSRFPSQWMAPLSLRIAVCA